MTRHLPTLLLVVATAGCATPTDQDLIRDALERRGGRAVFQEAGGAARVERGTLRGVPFEATLTYREPNQLRYEFRLAEVGPEVAQIFDGRLAVQSIEGSSSRLDAGEARILRNRTMDETAFWLIGLDDPNLTTELLPPGTFRGREARSIRVHHWSGYGRILHFDPTTAELMGAEGNTWTSFGRKYLETVYDRYQTFDGLRLPTRIEVFEGDELFSEAGVLSWTVATPPDEAFRIGG